MQKWKSLAIKSQLDNVLDIAVKSWEKNKLTLDI